MNRASITAAIEQILGFLEDTGRYVLPEVELQEYLVRTRSLLEKAHTPGEVLYAGILGGTGVGKSTLVNALAKDKISDASDRRPYTDKAVVYRHHDTPRGLEKVSDLLREPDAVHHVDTIRDLVLLDLPDFDSVEEENRRTVLRLLPELDAVIWVVSPEKYADAVFYDMVRRTRMHRDSFTFVLNKTDDLLADGHPDRYGRLKEVQGDLIFRLRHEARVEQPRLFSISADKEFRGEKYDPMPADEFRSFHNYLMVRRDAKEIASVKTINLVEETRRLLADLNARIHPEEKARILKTIDRIESESGGREERNVEGYEHEKALQASLLRHLAAEDASIASVRWAMRFLSRGRSILVTGSGHLLEAVFQSVAEARKRPRSAFLEKTGALMDSELLLAFRQGNEKEDEPQAERLLDAAVREASKAFVQSLEARMRSLSGPMARWRRFGQKLVLFMPVPFLVLRLTGLGRIEAWFESPSLSGAFTMMLALISSLFSSEGLTGLLVLAICQIFLVYVLAGRRIRKLEKDAGILAESAVRHLDSRLDAVVAKVEDQRRRSIAHMQEGIRTLSALTSEFPTVDSPRDRRRDAPVS
ncbi:MAG: GTPase [Desulfomonilaceae bacterium]|nr:GTPase [Desulfomonilaceae bacterium]